MGKVQGEGDYESAMKFDDDEAAFVKSGRVDQAARDAEPKSQAEADEMNKAEEVGKSRSRAKTRRRANLRRLTAASSARQTGNGLVIICAGSQRADSAMPRRNRIRIQQLANFI